MKKRASFKVKAAMSLATILAGGTMFQGCLNAALSVPVCGTIFTFCTPADQANAIFPILDLPDFNADPSCTIPLGCGDGDIIQNIPPGFPGGDAPEDPEDDQGGGLGGGGGAGGGGGGGGV